MDRLPEEDRQVMLDTDAISSYPVLLHYYRYRDRYYNDTFVFEERGCYLFDKGAEEMFVPRFRKVMDADMHQHQINKLLNWDLEPNTDIEEATMDAVMEIVGGDVACSVCGDPDWLDEWKAKYDDDPWNPVYRTASCRALIATNRASECAIFMLCRVCNALTKKEIKYVVKTGRSPVVILQQWWRTRMARAAVNALRMHPDRLFDRQYGVKRQKMTQVWSSASSMRRNVVQTRSSSL
jgi:hypothetical protein